MGLRLSRMRRNVTWIFYNARKNISATPGLDIRTYINLFALAHKTVLARVSNASFCHFVLAELCLLFWCCFHSFEHIPLII